MKNKFKILNYTIITLEGIGIEGLFHQSQEINSEISRPVSLKGIAPKIDYATGLSVVATMDLKKKLSEDIDKNKIGIIVATRTGNHKMAKDYGDKVRKGSNSSMMYSTSGHNICAGMSALSAKYNGPSIVLSDSHVGFGDVISIASNYLEKDDAEVMIVGQIDINDESNWGLGVFIAISKNEEAGNLSIDISSLLNEIYEEDNQLFTDRFNNELDELKKHSDYLTDAMRVFLFCENNIHESSAKKISIKSCLYEQITLEG